MSIFGRSKKDDALIDDLQEQVSYQRVLKIYWQDLYSRATGQEEIDELRKVHRKKLHNARHKAWVYKKELDRLNRWRRLIDEITVVPLG